MSFFFQGDKRGILGLGLGTSISIICLAYNMKSGKKKNLLFLIKSQNKRNVNLIFNSSLSYVDIKYMYVCLFKTKKNAENIVSNVLNNYNHIRNTDVPEGSAYDWYSRDI